MLDAHVQTINEENFEAEVLGAEVPVLVDFTAAWCAPCRALEPVLSALAKEGLGRMKVGAVDGNACPSLAARYGVRGFPTVIAFVGGREVGRQLGLTSKHKLLTLITHATESAATPAAR
jgi:thioredoxin 1